MTAKKMANHLIEMLPLALTPSRKGNGRIFNCSAMSVLLKIYKDYRFQS